jgi:predicted DNA-binding antitoxin AbrB/MazE fold protein
VNLGYVEASTMIRAVVKNGVIQPLEPLPADWKEGREVIVDDLAEKLPSESDEFDKWSEDMKTLTADLDDPQEWQEIQAVLAEADRQNKALVRREMGLL